MSVPTAANGDRKMPAERTKRSLYDGFADLQGEVTKLPRLQSATARRADS